MQNFSAIYKESLELLATIAAALLITLIAMAAYILYDIFSEPMWKREAIERGYALYCPDDGKFAWKGECDGQ